jgi:alpha-tubulin suppressor-like RCC1 family protein
LFLDDLGEVFSSGYNEYGELGLGMVPVQGKEKKDQDEGYDTDDQKAQIETKIELTPKVIKKLECIGFIAAGKNHSVAIRTNKTKDKELKMYTWGCGWHG